jgi:hypothetical protein
MAYNNFNLRKPKPVIIHDPNKVAMQKHVKYQPVTQEDMELLTQHTIIICVTNKQWGAQADFCWCTTYQGDTDSNPLASGASTVMTTPSFNNRTQAKLHAIQAVLLFLQMQLKHVWHQQMQFQVITDPSTTTTTHIT